MKIFGIYILLFALTLQSFYRSVMTMEYQIHLPDYIAQCINKDKPQLHCNGQCVLMKKIKAKEQKEARKNFLVFEYSSHYIHKDYVKLTMLPQHEDIFLVHFSPYLVDYRFEFNTSVFRPPLA